MSWSISAIGKPEAVAKKVRADIEACCSYLQGPEKQIAAAVGEVIQLAVLGTTGKHAVQVSACGHEAIDGSSRYQSVSITVGAIHGFTE